MTTTPDDLDHMRSSTGRIEILNWMTCCKTWHMKLDCTNPWPSRLCQESGLFMECRGSTERPWDFWWRL